MNEIQKKCEACDSEDVEFRNTDGNGKHLLCADCGDRTLLPQFSEFELVD